MNYRIYALERGKGYQHIATVNEAWQVDVIIDNLDPQIYDRTMVIKHRFDINADEPFLLLFLDKGKSRTRRCFY